MIIATEKKDTIISQNAIFFFFKEVARGHLHTICTVWPLVFVLYCTHEGRACRPASSLDNQTVKMKLNTPPAQEDCLLPF